MKLVTILIKINIIVLIVVVLFTHLRFNDTAIN